MKKLYFILLFFTGFLITAQQLRSHEEIEGFKLYPNPTVNNKVYIETADNAPKQIHVFDVIGTPVHQTTLVGRELNLGHLDRGVYIVRVTERDRRVTRKLVIK
ncbi:MAG: T9SS type A sorting domain-containing protein [Bacteroidota bacterium]